MSNPEINLEAKYDLDLDLWAIDLKLNSAAEGLLAKFKVGKTKTYTTATGAGKRYLIASAFIGKMDDMTEMQKAAAFALFDADMFGTGKRSYHVKTYDGVQNSLGYIKDIFNAAAKARLCLQRKVVAKISLCER